MNIVFTSGHFIVLVIDQIARVLDRYTVSRCKIYLISTLANDFAVKFTCYHYRSGQK